MIIIGALLKSYWDLLKRTKSCLISYFLRSVYYTIHRTASILSWTAMSDTKYSCSLDHFYFDGIISKGLGGIIDIDDIFKEIIEN